MSSSEYVTTPSWKWRAARWSRDGCAVLAHGAGKARQPWRHLRVPRSVVRLAIVVEARGAQAQEPLVELLSHGVAMRRVCRLAVEEQIRIPEPQHTKVEIAQEAARMVPIEEPDAPARDLRRLIILNGGGDEHDE